VILQLWPGTSENRCQNSVVSSSSGERVHEPTGRTVALNVARERKDLHLNYEELAARLAENGHPIAALALSRIERFQRRVDVDDLVALAAALGVSPLTLLLPPARNPEVNAATGTPDDVIAAELWAWARDSTSLDALQRLRYWTRIAHSRDKELSETEAVLASDQIAEFESFRKVMSDSRRALAIEAAEARERVMHLEKLTGKRIEMQEGNPRKMVEQDLRNPDA